VSITEIGTNVCPYADQLAYNAARHETTEYSLYYLMFGREYKTPLDLTLDVPEVKPPEECEYADQLRQRIQTA
jgi:hypothetical protein